jgi:hypothetical protein
LLPLSQSFACPGDRGRGFRRIAAVHNQGFTQYEKWWPEVFRPARLFRFRGQSLRLGDPAIGARRKSDFFADLMGCVVI